MNLLVWLGVATYHRSQTLPSNRLVRCLRDQPTLRSGAAAVLLAAGYFVIGALCAQGAASGGPGWLHVAVLISWWNAIKLFGHGSAAVWRYRFMDDGRSWPGSRDG